MKKLLIIFMLSVTLGFVACNNTKTDSKQSATIVETNIKIEGMTCEHGCAGTIEEEVGAMKGVELIDVDFDNETAIIKYDSTQVTEKAIFEKIETLNDGQYKVVKK